MPKLADLFIKLGLKDSEFKRGIKGAQTSTNKFGQSVKKIGGLIAGAFAIGQITSFIKSSIVAFDVQAKAEQQLLIALKGRGDAQQALILQARELQKITLFGDEETIKAQALIAAFVKEEKQIKRIIPLVQDLASAKMMSLAGAADLVSKTLGSSTNALSRYGIQVEGAVGSTERLESLARGLSDAFEGQAEAAAKVGTGAIKQLENAYGDLKESLGGLIITNGLLTDSLIKITSHASNLATVLEGDLLNNFEKFLFFIISNEGVVAELAKEERDLANATRELAETSTLLDNYFESLLGIPSLIEEIDEATEEEITTIKSLNEELEKQKKILNDINIADKTALIAQQRKIEGIQSEISEIDKLITTRKKDIISPIGTAQQGRIPNIFSPTADAPIDGLDLEALSRRMAEFVQLQKNAIAESLMEWDNFTTDMASTIEQGLENVAITFAQGLGKLISGEFNMEDFGKSVLESIGRFMQILGGLMITTAISLGKFLAGLSSLNPVVVGIAGGALIAAGAAVSSFARKGPSAATSGAGGGFGGGGFRGGFTPSGQERLITTIKGKDIQIVLQRTNNATNRIS